ncbi:MAG: hypothetical protein KKB31_04935 [Nanoarchaeota archaeon]|nr:hypothetical protein [Nanoarchaeota archaeon]
MEKQKKPYGFHIVIEGHDEEQMRALFEEIQNKYSFYDNCVFEEIEKEDTIIDDDRREETGHLITKGKKKYLSIKLFNKKEKALIGGKE